MNRPFTPFMLLLAPALLWGGQHAAAAGAAAGPERSRPNVVFILADDLGYGDVRSFGGDRRPQHAGCPAAERRGSGRSVPRGRTGLRLGERSPGKGIVAMNGLICVAS